MEMKKIIVLLFCITACFTQLLAQDKIILKEYSASEFIPTSLARSNMTRGFIFKVGESDFRPVGMMAKELEPHLRINDAAFNEFKRFKNKAKGSRYALILGYATWLATPLVMQRFGKQNTYLGILATGMGVSLTGFLGFIVLQKNAPKHIGNAVFMYNESLGQ